MLPHSQGLSTLPTKNAQKKEEELFMKTFDKVHVSKVPAGCNVMFGHVLYKV